VAVGKLCGSRQAWVVWVQLSIQHGVGADVTVAHRTQVRNQWLRHSDAGGVSRKPPKIEGAQFDNRGRPVWASSEGDAKCKAGPTHRLNLTAHLRPSCTHPRS
jgi:hypothetical protein